MVGKSMPSPASREKFQVTERDSKSTWPDWSAARAARRGLAGMARATFLGFGDADAVPRRGIVLRGDLAAPAPGRLDIKRRFRSFRSPAPSCEGLSKRERPRSGESSAPL